ncbi:MAG TPA: ECF transporter S component [Anaerolineales bacterium]|nr:ECF transporter S component [Anaerolineales bacterium]
MRARLLDITILLVSTLSGLLALLYPFFLPALAGQAAPGRMRLGEMPGLMTALVGLCLLVLLAEAQGQGMQTKLVALLGVLVAINSVLRFVETALPGPGGFTPVFFLIILTGYVFGGRVGFLMGALTMLVSALVTGGVGPWLPAQMFTAGWVGLSTPLARQLTKAAAPALGRHAEIATLAVFSVGWGFLYGALMNLWEWPFIIGPEAQSWSAGLGFWPTLQRYAVFYLATSLAWDLAAALGNLLLVLAFGAPVLRALRRFRQRFTFVYQAVAN